jgi:hypothetical protein
MSAIGLEPRPKAKALISCHADYRREHFMFARTQSSTLRNLAWEHRTKPLQSWDRLFYNGLGIAALIGVLFALLR